MSGETALPELTAWCERDFSSVRNVSISVVRACPGFAATARYPVPDPNDRVIYFDHLVNGRLFDEGEERSGVMANTPEEAEQEFRAGWERYRQEHPGDRLIWRRKPVLIRQDSMTHDETRYAVYCRVAIL